MRYIVKIRELLIGVSPRTFVINEIVFDSALEAANYANLIHNKPYLSVVSQNGKCFREELQ